MPSKKRKYNARFPAGRIKKIMQTDEEVGKVAQAVPIIISRTLELFVESLLSKAMQVTMLRNAKTLSPSHVKQCILAESRFDFLRDLVKNIPDVTAAEEREMLLSGESSPNSRFSDTSSAPRRVVREDSNSSSSSDIKIQQIIPSAHSEGVKRDLTSELGVKPKLEPIQSDLAMDLSKKNDLKPPNFYQETLVTDEVQHRGVIKINPTYNSPQPSTSSYTNIMSPVEPVHKVEVAVPKPEHPAMFYLDLRQNNTPPPRTPITPITPILNIDFSKNIGKPEIKVLDSNVANMVGVPKADKKLYRQNSKSLKSDIKSQAKPIPAPINVDLLNSGNLQIDEDYDT